MKTHNVLLSFLIFSQSVTIKFVSSNSITIWCPNWLLIMSLTFFFSASSHKPELSSSSAGDGDNDGEIPDVAAAA